MCRHLADRSDLMENFNIDELANKVADRMMSAKRAQWVDPETHANHHEWIKGKQAFESDIKALKRRIIMSACIWAVPLILAFAASALWRSVVAAIVGPK
jgi:hypothetical protein